MIIILFLVLVVPVCVRVCVSLNSPNTKNNKLRILKRYCKLCETVIKLLFCVNRNANKIPQIPLCYIVSLNCINDNGYHERLTQPQKKKNRFKIGYICWMWCVRTFCVTVYMLSLFNCVNYRYIYCFPLWFSLCISVEFVRLHNRFVGWCVYNRPTTFLPKM